MIVAPPQVRVRLLGAVDVSVDGVALPVRGLRLKAVIAVLALARGRVVPVQEILDAVWEEHLPDAARNALQYHVAVLRKTLAASGASDEITTRAPGYALRAETDVATFVTLAAEGREALADGRPAVAVRCFTDALNEWDGRALADIRELRFAESRAVWLEQQRLACLETWAGAELAAGRAGELVAPLQELVVENPTSELLWEQLIIALYRSGRQEAALAAYRSAREALDEELGLAPSARLQGVHQAVLRQDPRLDPLPALRSLSPRVLTRTTLVDSGGSLRAPAVIGPGGQRLVLDAGVPVVVGRHGDCDLVVDDDQASRRHAEIVWSGAGYLVKDLGSTNGTYVNGRRLDRPHLLSGGDRIEVGATVVRFVH
ncbi:DNA-binding transcriptional activator of the SARP family [Nocardioides terrae]|uniref:DNA-binding transcriptional activator of the SARP family n=1 Tax=Nocardioides terrae TaxID=574651 RepID=A0A1I1JGQ2_9ACTN|nr:BTAD domain-containing putative transcriptional regulator [Nocardioides terrae]SFC44620.1 DNA-binding transcriptional activator of the SARP family [Nocardioides terrae]